ncbi:MAG: hypothetical protein L0207_00855 [Chlamydiae bacterium]|nr:hypothetical protein [Chlamydiota bacterium]
MIFRLFLFSICLFSNWIYADVQMDIPYKKKIISIELVPRSENSHFIKGTIQLTDGSNWDWKPCICCGKKLDSWQVGDEIQVKRIDKEKYQLINSTRVSYSPTVTSLIDSYQIYPKITANEYTIYGRILSLSDGSHWTVNLWNTPQAYFWKVGDPVLITPYHDTSRETYYILDNVSLEKSLFSDNTIYANPHFE